MNYTTYEYHKSLKENAKTIVCLPGASEGAFRFYYILEKLKQNFNVILFNNPGVDGAEENLFFTIQELSKWVNERLEELDINKCVVLGHCMGGLTAQQFALDYPEKVEDLIIISSAGGSFYSMNHLEEIKKDKSIVTAADFCFTKEYQKENPELIKEYLEQKATKYKLPKRVLVSNFLAGVRFSSLRNLDKLEMPTLIIHGDEDILVPTSFAEMLASRIKNSELLLLKNIAHYPFMEDDSVVDHIVDFVNGKRNIGQQIEDNIYSKIADKDKQFVEEYADSFENFTRLKNFFNAQEIPGEKEYYDQR